MSSFAWRRPLVRGLVGVGAGGLVGLVGATSYTVKKINYQRSRYWSDSFTMTPEAMRMPFRSVSFRTEDGITLSGWYVPQTHRGKPSKRIIVCCNPYNHDRSTMLGVARGLWEASYSVLLFNFRSHAKLQTQQSIGHLEVSDARAALEWVRKNKEPSARIGVLGASMGGAMALTMAEENDDLVACATDCAFTSLYDVISHRVELEISFLFQGRPWLKKQFMRLVSFSNLFLYGYDLRQVGPGKNLGKISCPLLVVHSENDSIVPVSCAYDIYENCSTKEAEKEIVILKNVEHIGSYFQDEYGYVKRFVRFFDQTFDQSQEACSPPPFSTLARETDLAKN